MKKDRIVVGFDGSKSALQALSAAADMVSKDGVVHVLTAFEAPPRHQLAEIMASVPEEFHSTFDVLARPRGHVEEAAGVLRNAGVNFESHFVEDHPATGILDLAERVHADMIIVGSRGLGRGTRLIRGSVSSRVASHAHTSFLVVNEED